jgi:PadR family transcriptional regulator, regulatory protein PadR
VTHDATVFATRIPVPAQHTCACGRTRLSSAVLVYECRVHRIVLREIVLGLWKIHILHHAAKGGVVGNHMLHELREHGYDASPGTLYPLLHRMERHGWLRSDPDAGQHAARSYALTPLGARILAEVSIYVDELHREIEEESSPNTAGTGHEDRGKRRNE